MRRTPPGVTSPHQALLTLLGYGVLFVISFNYLSHDVYALGSDRTEGSGRSEAPAPTSSQGLELNGLAVRTSYLEILWPLPPSQSTEAAEVNLATARQACQQFGQSFLVGQGLWGAGIFDEFGCFSAKGHQLFAGTEPKAIPAWSLDFTESTEGLGIKVTLAPDRLPGGTTSALVAAPIEAGSVLVKVSPSWQYLLQDEVYSKVLASAVLDTMPASRRVSLPTVPEKIAENSMLSTATAPLGLTFFTWGVQVESGLWTAHVVGQAEFDRVDRMIKWRQPPPLPRGTVVYGQRRSGLSQGLPALTATLRRREQMIIDGEDEPHARRKTSTTAIAKRKPLSADPQNSATLLQPPPPNQERAESPPEKGATGEAAALIIPPTEQKEIVQEEEKISISPTSPIEEGERPLRPNRSEGTAENFFALRYGVETIDSGSAIFSPGKIITLFGEFRHGILDGLRLYSENLPSHSRTISTETFALNWNRNVIGWALWFSLSGLIDRVEITPKIGTMMVKGTLPDIDSQGNIVSRPFSTGSLKNGGLDLTAIVENSKYLGRLWYGRDYTFGSSGQIKHTVQSTKTGVELVVKGPALKFISNSLRVNFLLFDYIEDITFAETGGGLNSLNFVYSSGFAGGGLSLSW